MSKAIRCVLVIMCCVLLVSCYRAELKPAGESFPPYAGDVRVVSEIPYGEPYKVVGTMAWTEGMTYRPDNMVRDWKAEARRKGADTLVVPPLPNQMIPGTESQPEYPQFAIMDGVEEYQADAVAALRTLDKAEAEKVYAEPAAGGDSCRVFMPDGSAKHVDQYWYGGADMWLKRGSVVTRMKLGDVDYVQTIEKNPGSCRVW